MNNPNEIPTCMSPVIREWIVVIQDRMPNEIRDGNEWKSLLSLAAETGSEFEEKRLSLMLDWMWDILLYLQPIADKNNFGAIWENMIKTKTADAAGIASEAADYVKNRNVFFAYYASDVSAVNLNRAARIDAYLDARAAAVPVAAASTAAYYAASAIKNPFRAACVAYYVAMAHDSADDFWQKANPCDLLKKMIKIS